MNNNVTQQAWSSFYVVLVTCAKLGPPAGNIQFHLENSEGINIIIISPKCFYA